MSKVFVDLGMSLDGFVAGPNAGPKNPLGDRGTSIHAWIYNQRVFMQHLKLGDGGGETGLDNRMLEATFGRIGANIMGKRMFEEGEANWPEEAPFHTPVFVLTKERRPPWERPGGTTFHFVNDGIESALAQARKAAGGHASAIRREEAVTSARGRPPADRVALRADQSGFQKGCDPTARLEAERARAAGRDQNGDATIEAT